MERSQTGFTTVDNPSFQNPPLADGVANGEQFTNASPPSWTASAAGNAVGVDNPGTNMYIRKPDGTLPGTANGTQFGYLNLNGGNTGTFTYSGTSLGNFVAGVTYTLTVAVGQRLDHASSRGL